MTLDRVCAEIGYPNAIHSKQGSEFVSRDLDLWVYQYDVALDFSRPGIPTDNASYESFNGCLRAECLNERWFLTLPFVFHSAPEKVSLASNFHEHLVQDHRHCLTRRIASDLRLRI